MPLTDSYEQYYLRFAPAGHIRSLRLGCTMIFIAGLLSLPAPLLLAIAFAQSTAWHWLAPALTITLTYAVLSTCWAFGWFLVSRKDTNCSSRWDRPALRKWSRRVTVLAAVAVPVGVASLSGLVPDLSSDPYSALNARRAIVWCALALLLASIGVQMHYISSMMPRVPNRAMERWATALSFAIPGAGFTLLAYEVLLFFASNSILVSRVYSATLLAIPIVLLALAAYLGLFSRLQSVLGSLATDSTGIAFAAGALLRRTLARTPRRTR